MRSADGTCRTSSVHVDGGGGVNSAADEGATSLETIGWAEPHSSATDTEHTHNTHGTSSRVLAHNSLKHSRIKKTLN